MACRSHVFFVGMLLAATLFSAGCASAPKVPFVKQAPKANRQNPVVQIVGMWDVAEGRDPDGKRCRGFAGQILFLGNRKGTPVEVDGEVMIYVFDDVGTPEEQAKPIHQFRFDNRAWNQHLKSGSMGPSYHCFIPYTRPGNHEANCTIRMKLTPSDNTPVVTSESAHMALRGKSRLRPETDTQYAALPKQAYQTSRPLESRNSRTTTIPLEQRKQPLYDGDVQPAGYYTPETVEQRMRRIFEEYQREQAASSAYQADRPVAASSRMKLKPAGVVTAYAEVADDDRAANQISQASYEYEADDYSPLHPLTANTAPLHAPPRRHPLADDDGDAQPIQARSVAPWTPNSQRVSIDLSAPDTDDGLLGHTSRIE